MTLGVIVGDVTRRVAALVARREREGAGLPTNIDERRTREAAQLLSQLDSLDLQQYSVVGHYVRFDEDTVERLSDLVTAITASCSGTTTYARII